MRTLRTVTLLLAMVAVTLVSTPAAVASGAAESETAGPIAPVTGSLSVARLPGGTFDVQDRVFQFRDYPVEGSTASLSDPRLAGELASEWSWDVDALGSLPKPAWGSITITAGEGTWEGMFTGIQRGDREPVGVRAFLFGTGPYEGMCATLDISASHIIGDSTWIVDGVVHPVPMAG